MTNYGRNRRVYASRAKALQNEQEGLLPQARAQVQEQDTLLRAQVHRGPRAPAPVRAPQHHLLPDRAEGPAGNHVPLDKVAGGNAVRTAASASVRDVLAKCAA